MSNKKGLIHRNNEEWSHILNQFIQSYVLHPDSFSDEESGKIIYSFAGALGDVLIDASVQANVKDTWCDQKFSPNVQGLTVYMPSQRTTTSFNIGFDPDGFYLEIAPHYLSNLRYMGDDFWQAYIVLCMQANFDLIIRESAGGEFAAAARKQLNNKKSRVFSLLRDYMLFELSNSQYGTPSFASFQFYWPAAMPRKDLIRDLANAFKAVWKLDYQLWKVSYQKENKLKNLSNTTDFV